jgi:hypothetical protein
LSVKNTLSAAVRIRVRCISPAHVTEANNMVRSVLRVLAGAVVWTVQRQGTKEFALRDQDGYYLMVSALA